MFVRDYAKCILCWRCVQVCADDAQYAFAINFDGRGFDTRIATFFDKPLPETTCVFCGQCVGVCPSRGRSNRCAPGSWSRRKPYHARRRMLLRLEQPALTASGRSLQTKPAPNTSRGERGGAERIARGGLAHTATSSPRLRALRVSTFEAIGMGPRPVASIRIDWEPT